MKKDKFSKTKGEIIDNLELIKARTDTCTSEFGMYDEDSHLYNEIVDLLEDTENTYTLLELSMIVMRAKTVEKNVNGWLASRGENSIELTWPDILT